MAASSSISTVAQRDKRTNRGPRLKHRMVLALVALASLIGALYAVGTALTYARADANTLHVTDLINNPDSSDGHGNLIRVEDEQVAYCAQGALGYPKPGQTLERYGSLGIDELDYVVYHGYDGVVVTSVDGLNARKSESATMAAIWLSIADKRPDVLNFIPKYDEPFHGNLYYYERWQNIKDQAIKDAAWKLYQAGVAYANAGGGGIEHGCAILWLNRTPGGTNKTFIYQSLVTAEKQVQVSFSKTSAKAVLTDGNNEYALAGAKYQIFESATSKLAATVTTDSNGRASCTLQPNTSYYAVETAAPAGYALSSERIEFTTKGMQTDVSVSDAPKTFNLVVQKRDAITGGAAQAGCSLAGAEYELTSESTPGFSLTATTDEDGRCSFESIPLGTIHIRETKTPDGYLLDQTVHEYHVGASDMGASDTLTLEPEGDFVDVPISFDLEISKFINSEEADGSKIENPGAGISFQIISNTTNKAIGTITTDQDGFASTVGSWFGEGDPTSRNAGAIPYDANGYTVHEVADSTPAGVTPVDDWTIGTDQMANGARLRFIVNNKERRCRLQIVKIDAETGEPIKLAGFSFQLLDDNKQPVTQEVWYPSHEQIDTFITDDSGSVWLPQALKVGRYYLREIKTVAPYLLNTEDIAVDITDENPTAIVSIPNSQAYGKANITKTCSKDGVGIEGVEYDVRTTKDIPGYGGRATISAGSVVDHVTTDSAGHAQTKALPLGDGSASYEFIETKTAGGHALDATPIPFTLTYQDEQTAEVYVECSATNTPTTIEIHKTIKDDKDEPLAGATFAAWRMEDEADTVNNPASDTTDDSPIEENVETAATDTIPHLKNGVEALTATSGKDGTASFEHLEPGTWRIREISAPDGYLLNAQIHEVIVTDEGLIDGAARFQLTLENDFTKIDISKRDITDESEVPGAILTVSDSEGTTIDSWVSTDQPHRIEALKPGTYTLTEDQAPKGHDQAESIEFTVDETGEVQTVVMYDEPIEITGRIDKQQQHIEESGAGHDVIYTIDGTNTSNTWVDECTITDTFDCVQAGLAKLESITTPLAAGDFDGKFNVWYHITSTEDYVNESTVNATLDDGHENPWLETGGRRLDYSNWHLWKQDVLTTKSETLEVSALNLAKDQVIDAIRFEFGRVDETFSTRANEWERKDLKSEDDTFVSIKPSTDTKRSSAIIRLTTTAAFGANIKLENSAHIDLFRNGGGDKLEAHDDDHLVQKVVPELAQTGANTAETPLYASLVCCLFALVLAGLGKKNG